MKKLVLAGVIGGLLLSGCATTPANERLSYTPTVQNLSEPPIGVEAIANIGDKLLTQGTMSERKAVCFPSTQKTAFSSVVQTGCFSKSSETNEYEFFSSTGEVGSGKFLEITGTPMNMALRKSDNAICGVGFLGEANPKSCRTGLVFEKKNWVSSNANNFQQTLLYNGKVGSKINIAYREFSSDLARPAFNNNVEYDLSESKQIGYKGALLEVIDANNQMIKYKVLKNFQKN